MNVNCDIFLSCVNRYCPSEWQGPEHVTPLEGYEPAKPMLFASVFPVESTELEAMFDAVDRLLLNDSSITISKEQSTSLGSGLRCGFLGFLHMEVMSATAKTTPI